MHHRIKCLAILTLTTLLLMTARIAHAEYCMDYSPQVKDFVAKSGGSFTRACWPTQSECQAYYQKTLSDPVHKFDFTGNCYSSGNSGGGSGITGGLGGGKGSTENAIKQQLVQGVLNGLLNPPAPKKQSQPQPNAATLATQHKILQQQLAEKAAAERAYYANQQQLLVDLKGDIAMSKPNTIDLKMPPEPSAVGQLGLLEREGRQAVSEGKLNSEKRSDWENPPKNLPAAILPKVPDPGPPVNAENEIKAKHAQDLLKDLLGRIGTSRQTVDKLDQEVKQLESTVAHEEQKATTEKKTDDDALRKAREALQRAKENREKAAAELRQLEEQEKQARSDMQQLGKANNSETE